MGLFGKRPTPPTTPEKDPRERTAGDWPVLSRGGRQNEYDREVTRDANAEAPDGMGHYYASNVTCPDCGIGGQYAHVYGPVGYRRSDILSCGHAVLFPIT